ncbi:hypothetical protein AA650_11435 [Anabaena sp. WA102]|jgi:hypothetical protein|uniref:hypothetical protein n=1 Tax=Anabaena sp. WA102 TaxID=1647413 RepID=UPI0006AC1412|nr:hypothetical protein [Anabaena sp. WA102]ALB41001.1 hypothetical protein AA650_11435 [Anabaena sp. WA102]
MTISGNSQFPNLISQNLESSNFMSDRSSATLGAELVYTQDASGRYLTFYWQHSQYLECDPQKIVDVLSQ